MTDESSSTFFSPCPRGLEPVLAEELADFRAQSIEPHQGGVKYSGPFDLCYHVNLKSRIASRVLWQIAFHTYRHEQDIYETALDVPWTTWFLPKHRIKVHVSAQHCPLPSLNYLTLRIKDAVCDHFRKVTGIRPSVDTRSPDVNIYAFLDAGTITLYLDTSGVPLFKRGFRLASGPTPLRENLAAGILRLAKWTPQQVLLDPMCGSGTFLLEAALIAANYPPGLGRRFGFEKLRQFDPQVWKSVCQDSRTHRRSVPQSTLYGYDLDAAALHSARMNLDAAGFADSVQLQQGDVLEVRPPHPHGILVTNPPYGVRTGEDDDLTAWYPQLGDALKQHFAGWHTYFLSADARFPKLLGLAATRRTPLFNGALECRLLEYPIVDGTMRSRKKVVELPA